MQKQQAGFSYFSTEVLTATMDERSVVLRHRRSTQTEPPAHRPETSQHAASERSPWAGPEAVARGPIGQAFGALCCDWFIMKPLHTDHLWLLQSPQDQGGYISRFAPNPGTGFKMAAIQGGQVRPHIQLSSRKPHKAMLQSVAQSHELNMHPATVRTESVSQKHPAPPPHPDTHTPPSPTHTHLSLTHTHLFPTHTPFRPRA